MRCSSNLVLPAKGMHCFGSGFAVHTNEGIFASLRVNLDNVKRWLIPPFKFLVKFKKEEIMILENRGNVYGTRQISLDLCLEYHIGDY